jgi:uncharacterized protein (TIGR02452 family)
MQVNPSKLHYNHSDFAIVKSFPKGLTNKSVEIAVTNKSTTRHFLIVEQKENRGLGEKIARFALGFFLSAITASLAYRLSASVQGLFSEKKTCRYAQEVPDFFKIEENVFKADENQDEASFRTSIYVDTKKACEAQGYTLPGPDGIYVPIDNTSVIERTRVYETVDNLPEDNKKYETAFLVTEDDTFNVAERLLLENPNRRIGVLNMANKDHPGGGVKTGCSAQEEALSRRSNLMVGLETQKKTQKYHIPPVGGIYSPGVQVFRKSGDGKNGYEFMEKPFEVGVVSVPAYDLRLKTFDRQRLGIKLDATITPELLNKPHSLFLKGTAEKIRNMLRTLAKEGHEEIVLSAFGCGAFKNNPKVVAGIFKDIFNEKEFLGRFKAVHFAILNSQSETDQANVDEFTKVCKTLSETNVQ